MPRLPIDYTRTIIYKLVCKDTKIKDCYVGATTDFTKRKYAHKHCCINENSKDYNLNVYQFIRANNGWNNWDMIMIEEYNTCKNKLESDTRERYWIEILGAILNNIIPSQSLQEWTKKNKERITEYHKDWYEKNKNETLLKHKEWKQNNKKKCIEQNKEWYEKTKNKRMEKITCNCGSTICKTETLRHNKSQKHINFILNSSIVLLPLD